MSTIEPTIPLGSDTTTRLDKGEVDRALRDLAHATRGLVAEVSLGGQIGGARTFNVRVRDGRMREVSGRFLLRVWIAPTLGAAPGGTQTATVTRGVLVQAITAGQALEVMTDTTGRAAIDVDGAAGSRGCHAVVLGGVYGLGGAWT